MAARAWPPPIRVMSRPCSASRRHRAVRSAARLSTASTSSTSSRASSRRRAAPTHLTMNDLPLTGGCNCGAVRYEVTEPLVVASYCHCKRCQRRSGAAASANAHPAPGAFRIVSGEDRLRVWKPENGGEKWFCGDCGSAMFGRNPQPRRSGRHPHGDVRRRPGDPPERPSVRRLRRALGADPRRRTAALPREPPHAELTAHAGTRSASTSSPPNTSPVRTKP